MLNVYAWSVCPHCHQTIDWLKKHHVDYEYLEVEEQPIEVINKIIEVNGGDDWVVPTLEFNGQWLAGKEFSSEELEADLKKLGVIA